MNTHRIYLIFACIVSLSIHDLYGQRRHARRMSMATIVNSFEQGDISGTEAYLLGNPAMENGRDRLLYYLQLGQTLSLQGKFAESNRYFELAYQLTDDARSNVGNEAAALLTNATARDYTGENIEVLLINYYKTLNFIHLNQLEKALVECRQMDLRLQQLNDKYKNENKFKRDAFVHLLMGITYDAMKEPNNAFVAYRNAYEIYRDDYGSMFAMGVPEQLKYDLMRTAKLSGMDDELQRYEETFGITLPANEPAGGDVLFFWNNGLSPVKVENSVTFTSSGLGGGMVFVDEMGEESFNFSEAAVGAVAGLTALLSDGPSIVKVAFPKYQERPLYHTSGRLVVAGQSHPLHLAEDVNQIALKTLQDRWTHEMGQSLLRFAAKQLVVAGASKAVEQYGGTYGSLISQGVSFFGKTAAAATEKADTRAWTSMPANILYSRVPLPEGSHQLTFVAEGAQARPFEEDITLDVHKGQTTFYTYTSFGDMASSGTAPSWRADERIAGNSTATEYIPLAHADGTSAEWGKPSRSSSSGEAFAPQGYFTIGGGYGDFLGFGASSATLGWSVHTARKLTIDLDVEGIFRENDWSDIFFMSTDVGIKFLPSGRGLYVKPTVGFGYLIDNRGSYYDYFFDEYISDDYEDYMISVGTGVGYQFGFSQTGKTKMDLGLKVKIPFSIEGHPDYIGETGFVGLGLKFMF